MTRKTLLGTISDRAEKVFGIERLDGIISTNLPEWKEWEKVWWAEAKKFVEELRNEGLTETVNSLDKTLKSLDRKGEYYELVQA